jgi:hypothetical protein
LPSSISVCLIEHATDLHVGNILFHSASIASWSSQEEVYQYLEPPCRYDDVHQCETKELGPLSPHVPEYIVGTPDPTPLLKLCLSDPTQLNIRICDFSEAFIYPRDQTQGVHTSGVCCSRNPIGQLPESCIGCMGIRCPIQLPLHLLLHLPFCSIRRPIE